MRAPAGVQMVVRIPVLQYVQAAVKMHAPAGVQQSVAAHLTQDVRIARERVQAAVVALVQVQHTHNKVLR